MINIMHTECLCIFGISTKENEMKGTLRILFYFAIVFLFACQETTQKNTTDAAATVIDTTQRIKEKPEPAKKTIPPLPSWPENAKSQKGKRFPFDEAVKDASLVTFRNQVYQAAWGKDLDKLLSFIADDIKFSFGAESGKADFIKAWQLDNKPEESALWGELLAILKLGGGFGNWDPDHFYAPYIFVLEDIDDPYTGAIVTGENVRLRAGPSSKSDILGSLSWDLVEIQDQAEYANETIGGESHVWQKVKTAKAETGFVYEKYLRTPVDYRAGFVKKDGKWIMNLFIAGD